MNFLKYMKYLSLIAEVVDAAKNIRRGQEAAASSPLSVNGKRGTLTVTFQVDEPVTVSTPNA